MLFFHRAAYQGTQLAPAVDCHRVAELTKGWRQTAKPYFSAGSEESHVRL